MSYKTDIVGQFLLWSYPGEIAERKELGKERFVKATATWWAIQRSPPSPPLSELLVSAHPCTCSPGSPQTVQTKIKIDAFSKNTCKWCKNVLG